MIPSPINSVAQASNARAATTATTTVPPGGTDQRPVFTRQTRVLDEALQTERLLERNKRVDRVCGKLVPTGGTRPDGSPERQVIIVSCPEPRQEGYRCFNG